MGPGGGESLRGRDSEAPRAIMMASAETRMGQAAARQLGCRGPGAVAGARLPPPGDEVWARAPAVQGGSRI
jgi:hypothetical protein